MHKNQLYEAEKTPASFQHRAVGPSVIQPCSLYATWFVTETMHYMRAECTPNRHHQNVGTFESMDSHNNFTFRPCDRAVKLRHRRKQTKSGALRAENSVCLLARAELAGRLEVCGKAAVACVETQLKGS